MRKNIEVIPAKPIREIRGLEPTAKTRVCAYCRVSTDNEEQIGSFDAQVSYYKKLISSKGNSIHLPFHLQKKNLADCKMKLNT